MSFSVWFLTAAVALIIIYLVYDWRKNKISESRNELKLNGLHKMGLLSQVWHRMYLKGESPIIHGFEYSPNVGFESAVKFWTSIAQDNVTFRSIPHKIGKTWYWKELPLNKIDFNGYHILKIEISAKDFENNKNNECNIDRALCHFVNKLNMNAKWPKDKPHWNVHYITFKEEHLQHKSYGYARIHHAMGDGILLSKLLERQHAKIFPQTGNEHPQSATIYENGIADIESTIENTPQNSSNNVNKYKDSSNLSIDQSNMSMSSQSGQSLSSMENLKPIKGKNRKSKKFSLFEFCVMIPWTFYDFVIRFLFMDSAPVATPISVGYRYNDEWGKNEKATNNNDSNIMGIAHKCQMAVSSRLDLKIIRKLSKYHNGTINDFIVTLFCASVNRYMKLMIAKKNLENNNNNNNNANQNDTISMSSMSAMDEYSDLMLNENIENNDNNNLWNILKQLYGNDFYIRFVSIFNLRSLVSNNLDKLFENFSNGEFDNEIAMIALRLPIGDMSFNKRINLVKSYFYRMKYGPMPLLGGYFIKLMYYIGGVDLVVSLMEWSANKCNIMLSNLMGPKEYLAAGNNPNNKIWNLFNITNPTNLPITCGVMSYVNNITLTVAADISTMKDPYILIDCIHYEFDQLLKQYEKECMEEQYQQTQNL